MIPLLLALALAQSVPDEPVAHEEVEVRAPEEVAASSASVTVVTVSQLPPSADVATAIDGAPGTAVRRLGGLGSFASVSIRGSSARQVEVFLDGVPLNPEGEEVPNLAELPLRAFERVEVYRGSAPPELGASAIGGVVNLVTGEISGARGSVGAGSWGALAGHVMAASEGERGDVLVIADGLRTDGRFTYYDDRGTPSEPADDRLRVRQNNDLQQGALHVRARRGPWSLTSASVGREAGVPGFTWLPIGEARARVLQELLVVGWQRATGAHSTGAHAWTRVRGERLEDPAGEVLFSPGTTSVGSTSAGLRVHDRWSPSRGLVWIGAAELRAAGIRSGGAWLGGRQAAEGSVAAVLVDPTERVALTPVVQGTVLADGAGGSQRTTAFAAPRLGLLVELGPHAALTANLGSYLRPPDLQERFGNQGVLVGNADLLPERGLSADAGLRLLAGEVRGELVGFVGRAQDQIGWVQNAQGQARPENLDQVDTIGAEAATTGAAGAVDWRTSLTWTRAVQRSEVGGWDGQPVPGVPAVELHQGLGLGSAVARLGGSFDLASSTTLDGAGLLRTAPRSLVGLSGRVTDGPLSIELEVLNLLNRLRERSARDPLVDDGTTATRPVTDFLGYPLPGRTLMLTLRLEG